MSTPIYVGRWTDWSHGAVFGDRVTLSNSNAGILIAFIAIFDSVVGGVAWSLVAYLFHASRADLLSHDGLYHQHQVLLRNSQSAVSFASQSMQAGWYWRRIAPRAMFRSLLLSLFPLGIALLFTLAGIFSSQIANTGEVLLQAGACGGVVSGNDLSDADAITLQSALIVETAQATDVSQAYAQTCYNNTLSAGVSAVEDQLRSKSSCGYFVQPKLGFNVSQGIDPCPFESLCIVPDSQVLSLDTGYLDSLADLGQNQPPENRVQFRRKQTCSPIATNMTLYNIDGLEKLGNVTAWYYGTNVMEPTSFLDLGYFGSSNGLPGITFIYSEASYYAADSPYYLMSASTLDYDDVDGQIGSQPSFTPSPKLISDTSAPVTLIFLANRALYYGEVTDPWFNGTSAFDITDDVRTTHLYQNTNPGAVLGCIEQGQICNPNAPGGTKCTDMDSWYTWIGIPDAFHEIGLNEAQISTASGIHNTFLTSSAYSVTTQLGGFSLAANQYFATQSQGFSPALPPNQWQIEVSNWFGTGLAGIQSNYIANSRKPVSNPNLLKFWQPFTADDKVDQSLCSSQKVRNTSYQSFSVAGLVLNFVLGCLILISSCVITNILPDLRKSQRDKPKRQQWVANGVLQLQRTAYEKLELGDWEGNEKDVPVTRRGQMFKAHMLGTKTASNMVPLKNFGGRRVSLDQSGLAGASTRMLNPNTSAWDFDDEDDHSHRTAVPSSSLGHTRSSEEGHHDLNAA